MVKHGTPEASAYANQVDRLRVVSECTCGCPTVDLGLDGRLAAPSGGSLIIADALGTSAEGTELNVILHVKEDAIACLEVYSLDGSGPFGLPVLESLRSF
jgi:hypothetical protein